MNFFKLLTSEFLSLTLLCVIPNIIFGDIFNSQYAANGLQMNNTYKLQKTNRLHVMTGLQVTTSLERLKTSLEAIQTRHEVTRKSRLSGGGGGGGAEPRSGTRVGEGRGNIKHV